MIRIRPTDWLLPLLWLAPLATGCKQAPAPPPSPEAAAVASAFEPFPAAPGAAQTDRWFVIQINGKDAGFRHERASTHQTPRGMRRLITTEERTLSKMGDIRLDLTTQNRWLEAADGSVVRFSQIEQEKGQSPTRVEAGRVGDELVISRGPEVRRLPFEPKALGHDAFRFLLTAHPPAVGLEVALRTFSEDVLGYEDNRLTVRRVREDPPGEIELDWTASNLPGVVSKIRLDREYEPVWVDAPVGPFRVTFQRTDQQPPLPSKDDVYDMSRLAEIPIAYPGDPGLAARIRYRIEGLPAFVDAAWLTGPGQRVVEKTAAGAFVIEVSRLPAPPAVAFPPPVTDPALNPFLASTALTRLDDPVILQAAQKTTAGAKEAWEAARRLRQFVSLVIEGDERTSFGTASDVLRSQKGDCTEQSVLLAALARAVGIPSRCATGLVYTGAALGRHMWTEVWVGRWQPLDAAMETDQIGPTWIRLGTYELGLSGDVRTGLAGMLAFAADLRITVEALPPETAKP